MATLVAPPVSRSRDQGQVRWLIAAGGGAAALAAAVALAMLSAVTVLLWALGPGADSTITAAPFRGAATLWLMAQLAPAQTLAGELQIAPLAITAGVAALTARVAAWAVRQTRAFDLRPAAVVVAGLVLGHVVVAAAAAAFSSAGGAGVDVRDAVRAAAVFALACAVLGATPHTWWWARPAAAYAGEVRAFARAVAAGTLVLLGGGVAIVAAAVAWHHRDAGAALDAVGGGLSGNAGTVLLCLALLPNAALWVVALGAGPGFALGTDAGLDLGGMQEGALPALPLFAALPGAGPLPAVAFVPVLLPLAAGAMVGWFARTPKPGPRAELVRAVLAGLACGVVVGVLAGVSGGGVGGRLAEFGPGGVAVGGALGLEVAAVAAVVVGARIGYERLRTAAPEPAPEPAVAAVVAAAPAVPDRDDTDEIPPGVDGADDD